MIYGNCTPETVYCERHIVENVKEWIIGLKEIHPHLHLGKADLYVLSWNKPGYVRSNYIVLYEVSEEELKIIREVC